MTWLCHVTYDVELRHVDGLEIALRSVPKPPEDYVDADGHVNFTGSWKCKSAEGDLDGVFADMGIGRIHVT